MILKGAIDSIHPDRVGGWIYSDVQSVRGAEVQAFVDRECVGSGRVDLFREDLADAGLSDGYLGFSFPITLNEASDSARVIVRLSESDFVLLPPQARVRGSDRFSAYGPSPYNDSSVELMRKRGWLTNAELSFLKFVRDLGVFDLSLVRPKAERVHTGGHLFEPKDIAADYLSLLALTEAEVKEIELQDPSANDIVASVGRVCPKSFPTVGLLANQVGHLELVEGSHKDNVKLDSLAGSVQHSLGPDRLLFVNLLCLFALKFDHAGTSLRLFVANGT